tara:strand:+ start:164 stop:2014 length:1851 start_codon:yes stop_codon:yes gene_type:complete
MEVAEVEVVAKTAKAEKNIEGLEGSIENLSKVILESNKQTQDALSKVSDTAEETEKGIKKIGGAISKAGVGLVLLAFTQLKDVFSQNQKVVDLLAVAFETVSLVLSEFVGTVIDILETTSQTSGAFDALGKVLINVLKLAITPFKAAFFGIKLAVQEAQLIWEQSVFGSGDTETIDALNASILVTQSELNQVKDDMIESAVAIKDNIGEAIEEVGNVVTAVIGAVKNVNIEAALATAKQNVELQKASALAEAEGVRLLESYDLQAETLRQVRDEERNTIAERKEANDKLLIILNQQNEEMLKQATIIRDAAQAQYDKNKTDENKLALLQAETEIIAVQATVKGLLSEQLANDLALEREIQELKLTGDEAEANRQNDQRNWQAEQITGTYLRLLAQKDALETESAGEIKRLEEKRDLYKKGTQAFKDAQDEIADYKQATDQKMAEIDKAMSLAKIDIAKMTLASLANIFGKESKAGKAAAIALTTIETLQSSVSAFKSLASIPVVGPVLGGIAAASALATGYRTVKQIIGTKLPTISGVGGGSGGGGGGGRGSGAAYSMPSIPSMPAAFNVVGTTGTNQLADAIGSQNQAPVKAYVVSGDVTTSQSLDRNIVESATL